MAGLSTIHELLRDAGVPFTVVTHPPPFSAQEDMAMCFSGRHRAKVVVCVVDGEPIDAVIPAPLAVHLDRLLELAGGREIQVAAEEELRRLSPIGEAAAMSPLGPVRARAVFVDVSLASGQDVVFSADMHVDAIVIRWADFARRVKPIVGNFAGPPTDRVPAYRLSYRE